MPDTKGSQLPTLSIMSDDDVFICVDNPTVTPTTRRLTFANMKKGLYRLSPVEDVDYTALATDLVVYQTGEMTAPRTITLPPAASVPAGYGIRIGDDSGTVDGTNTLSIEGNGGDTIMGSVDPVVINKPNDSLYFVSNGLDNWNYELHGLRPDNNLSDLVNAATARTNLGLGNSATRNVGTTTGTVAAGDDARFTNALQSDQNLADLGDASIARTNLQLGGAATLNVGTAADTVAAGDDARFSSAAQKSANLSDLANAGTARTNLGLGDVATKNTGTTAGTIAAGDDSRFSSAAQKSANLSDLANASAARTNLGLGTMAQEASEDYLAVANNLDDVADAATARTNLGLGDAATLDVGTTTGTVAAGDDSRITGAAQKSSNLSDLANAGTARTNLGLDPIATKKSNLSATTDPAVGNDGTQGYAEGSIWVNTTTNKVWFCTDASTGAAVWRANSKIKPVTLTLDGGGNTITTGFKAYAYIPYAATIKAASLIANTSGSIVVDVWKRAFASGVPTVAHTITASAKPTLSSAQTSRDATLTGWTTSVAAGDVLGFNVDSVSGISWAVLLLELEEA